MLFDVEVVAVDLARWCNLYLYSIVFHEAANFSYITISCQGIDRIVQTFYLSHLRCHTQTFEEKIWLILLKGKRISLDPIEGTRKIYTLLTAIITNVKHEMEILQTNLRKNDLFSKENSARHLTRTKDVALMNLSRNEWAIYSP